MQTVASSAGTKKSEWAPRPGATLTGIVLPTLGLALAYYAAARVCLLSADSPAWAMAVWPPAGIALAGMLLFGYRVWPGIIIAALATALQTHPGDGGALLRSAGVATTIGVGAALQATVGALLIRRFVGFPKALDEAGDVTRFLFLGGPVACAIGATWTVAVLTAAGVAPRSTVLLTWSTQWVAASTGVMMVTPLALIWIAEPAAAWRARRASVGLPLLAALALAVVVFPRAVAWEQTTGVDFGPRSSAVVHETAHRFAGAPALRVESPRPRQFWREWALLSTALAFTGLLTSLLLVVTGRTLRSEALALENSVLYRRYRSLFDEVPIGLYRAAVDGRILDVNPAFLRMLDYPSLDALDAVNAASVYLDAQLWERWRAEVERNAPAKDAESQLKRSDGSLMWVQASISATRDSGGRIVHYEGAIVDISARKQAQAHVEALNDIVAASAAAADLRAFLGTLLDRTLAALEGDAGGAWLGAGNFVHRHMPHGLTMEGITAAAQTAGLQPTQVEAVENWESATGPLAEALGPIVRPAGVRGSIVAPLLVDGRRIGGLLIMTARPRRWSASELRLVEAVGRQVGTVAERLQLLDDVRAHARDMEVLHSFGAELRRSGSLGEIYGLVTQRAMTLLHADYAELVLLDPDGRTFQRTCVRAGSGVSIGRASSLVDDGVVATAIERAGAFTLTDLSTGAAPEAGRGRAGTPMGPCLAVPLREGERVIGALAVARRRIGGLGPFATRDTSLATALAELASHAIDRTQLAQQVAHELANVRGLYESAQRMAETLDPKGLADEAVRRCVDTFGATAALIAKLDDAGRPLSLAQYAGQVELEPAVTEWVGATTGETFRGLLTAGKSIVLESLEARTGLPVPAPLPKELGVRAAGIFPLTRRAGPGGALILYTNRAAFFSAERVEFLQAYAQQLAGALENASLHEDSTRRLAQLQAFHEIDQVIAGSSDLHATLNIVLAKTMTQLHADAAAVLLLNPHRQVLEYAAGQGFVTTAPRHVRLRLGDGLVGRAALERRCVGLVNLETEPGALRLIDPTNQPAEGFKAAYAVPLIAKGQLLGVLSALYRRPMTPDEEGFEFLDTLARQTAIAISDAQHVRALQRSRDELMLAYDTTLEGWARALELRDKETEGHTQRVSEMTVELATRLGVSEPDLVQVRRGALLHDIGKIAISDTILLKPGPLTEDERRMMELHPGYAHQLLSPIAYLRPVLDIPYCHHEKWDGTGYPQRLSGDRIPLSARIFAVVDVWDALTQDRPYRRAWSIDRAREYISTQRGRQFDPDVTDAFLEMAADGREREAGESYADVPGHPTAQHDRLESTAGSLRLEPFSHFAWAAATGEPSRDDRRRGDQ